MGRRGRHKKARASGDCQPLQGAADRPAEGPDDNGQERPRMAAARQRDDTRRSRGRLSLRALDSARTERAASTSEAPRPSFSGYLATEGAGKQISPVPLLAPGGLVSLCERGPATPLPLFCQDHVFHRRSLRRAHPQMKRRGLGRVDRHLSALRRR
jgi:hypothetical protein